MKYTTKSRRSRYAIAKARDENGVAADISHVKAMPFTDFDK